MIKFRKVILMIFLFTACFSNIIGQFRPGNSIYTQKIDDPKGIYFTPQNFNIRSDGKADVSDQLQSAINQLKKEKNFGILFIPEGIYAISKTIYVPANQGKLWLYRSHILHQKILHFQSYCQHQRVQLLLFLFLYYN